jgi:bifunctional isochorismate lyase / aryl carrier protein
MSIPPIHAYPLPSAADLPAPRVDWRPEPARTALLVHDMQHHFTERFVDSAPLGAVTDHIAALRKVCADLGIPVLYTAQPGGQSPAERGLLGDFWGAGLPADPAKEAIVPALAPGPDDQVVVKRRYSAFVGSDFADRLGGRDQLVVTGIYAHIGVAATACDAFMRDIQPFVLADAVADFSAAHHRDALRYVADRCGRVLTTGTLIELLRGTA